MDKSILRGDWNMIKGKVKEHWGKLTDNDLMEINGKREQLLGFLQKKYGYAKEKAETELRDWEKRNESLMNQNYNESNQENKKFAGASAGTHQGSHSGTSSSQGGTHVGTHTGTGTGQEKSIQGNRGTQEGVQGSHGSSQKGTQGGSQKGNQPNQPSPQKGNQPKKEFGTGEGKHTPKH